MAIPGKNPEIVEVLFDEFDAYLERTTNPSGREVFHLVLGHRHSPTRIPELGDHETPRHVQVEWEFLLRYMDVAKPLPDIPLMEPFRDRDPVTVEYDKKHNRPPRYWRDMDIQKAQQMHRASSEAANRFPWGLTREQAIASGWQPSGYGEGAWRVPDAAEKDK
ncbi:MAG: hypothetical protein M0036_20170 [Desulfobacteraceae bacterium]|nr:hypothetical protein [Desulfobacteraceae bacterium]